MRERYEVELKYAEMRDRRLRERKEKYLSVSPINCKSNMMLKIKGRGRFRFCQNQKVLDSFNKKAFLCQDDETARACSFFDCKHSHESVEDDFEKVLRSPSRCGNDYPKLAVLIWFLQDHVVNTRFRRLWDMFGRVVRGLWGILSLRWW